MEAGVAPSAAFLFQGYRHSHSSIISMFPKTGWLQMNIFCKPQQQASKKFLNLTTECCLNKIAGKVY